MRDQNNRADADAAFPGDFCVYRRGDSGLSARSRFALL